MGVSMGTTLTSTTGIVMQGFAHALTIPRELWLVEILGILATPPPPPPPKWAAGTMQGRLNEIILRQHQWNWDWGWP